MKSVLLVLGVGNDGVVCRRCRCRHHCRRYHRHHYRCLCYRPCRYCYRRHNCYVQFNTNNDTNDITLTCSLLYRLLKIKRKVNDVHSCGELVPIEARWTETLPRRSTSYLIRGRRYGQSGVINQFCGELGVITTVS